MQTNQGAEATRLELLTNDGAIAVELRPAIEPQHYAELHELVKEFDSKALAQVMVTDAAKR